MKSVHLFENCPNCHINFSTLGEDYGLLIKTGKNFTCPNCHKMTVAKDLKVKKKKT